MPHSDQQALHLKDLLQLCIARPYEDRVLELVDPVVELSQDREEAVYETIDDPVQQERGTVDRLVAVLVAPPDLGKRRAIIAMDRDQETIAVEAMHLDQPIPVGRSAVDDQEDEVVVVVDFRALLEMLRVFDRERMELEGVAQDLEVIRPGLSRSSQKKLPFASSSETVSRPKWISLLPPS